MTRTLLLAHPSPAFRAARARAAQHVLQLAQHGVVPGHGRRLREGDRHQGRRRAEGDRRDAGADQGRAREPEGRHLVGGRRRQLPAGGRRRPARAVPLAQRRRSSTTGRSASPIVSKNHVAGVYGGILALGYNTEIGEKKKLPVPKCWKDLLDPALKGEVMLGNPNSSGTAYLMLARWCRSWARTRRSATWSS